MRQLAPRHTGRLLGTERRRIGRAWLGVALRAGARRELIEFLDPVIRGERFGFGSIEHVGVDPLVSSLPQGRVRGFEITDGFEVDPRRAGDETDQDSSTAEPVIATRVVPAQR